MPENVERRFQPEPPEDDNQEEILGAIPVEENGEDIPYAIPAEDDKLEIPGVLSTEDIRQSRVATARREKMTPEEREADTINVLLEIYEEGLEKKYVTSADSAEGIAERVQKARESGIDLSGITNLNERLEKLQREAPIVVMRRNLKEAEKFSTDGDREMVASAAWYWAGKRDLERLSGKLSPELAQEIRQQLKSIAERIGIDDSLPIVTNVESEPLPTPDGFEWQEEDASEERAESYEAKTMLFESIQENATQGLEQARERLSQYHRWYDLQFADAREQFAARLPNKSELTDQLLTELTKGDKGVAGAFNTMEQLYNDSQQQLRALLESAQPEFSTIQEIQEVKQSAQATLQMINEKESQLREQLQEWDENLGRTLSSVGYQRR